MCCLHKTHYKLALIFPVLFSILLAACSTAAPTQTPGTSASALSLVECQVGMAESGTAVNALCGKLPVHENPQDPASPTIELNVVVIPAVSRSPQPDPVFLLAGGPGQAAVEAFGSLLPVFNRINQQRDLVLVDQRGTGGSHPLNCPQVSEKPVVPGIEPSTEDQVNEVKACVNTLQGDTKFYTTSTFIQDLDQVRAALGYSQINLVGISYGTRVGLAYLRQFPQNVRSVVLDGVTPMDWSLGPNNSASGQRAADLMFKRCAEDEGCHTAFPNLPDEFNSLMAALKEKPVELSLPHPVTGEMTKMVLNSGTAANAIFLLSYMPETTALLPLLIHTAQVEQNYQPLAAQYLLSESSLSEGIADGLYFSVICAEDVPFFPAQILDTGSYLSAKLEDIKQMCDVWPHAQVDPAFKQPVHSDKPVLLLSGEADPITPPGNAETAARTLTNSLSIVAPGMGHNVIFRGCIPRLAADFIDQGSAAGLDTSCVNSIEPMPFFLNFSGPHP